MPKAFQQEQHSQSFLSDFDLNEIPSKEGSGKNQMTYTNALVLVNRSYTEGAKTGLIDCYSENFNKSQIMSKNEHRNYDSTKPAAKTLKMSPTQLYKISHMA